MYFECFSAASTSVWVMLPEVKLGYIDASDKFLYTCVLIRFHGCIPFWVEFIRLDLFGL
jgi:hypothetical protein